ncbi:MAG: phosphate ABC transporter permease PstA [Chloroflexota bacterium]|nr:phosphate ABC transporter permease PstA [Chloroflexota bacterium]MDE2942169.1 phosphate ABC transporter permease PstA [Chloroflexota bacterium]MDE3267999.1 phosphate ABC transporter permease PstA [Chloroflexota bacterium]
MSRTVRKARGTAFILLAILATSLGMVALAALLLDVLRDGIGVLSLEFINSFPHYQAEKAGAKSALAGTLWVMSLTAVFAMVAGVGAAIYLEEFAVRNWFTRIVEININNLAGVPSVVYGLLGLAIFVYWMGLGRSVLAGALTLALLILPIIVVAAREGLRSVPPTIREAAMALGSTRWQAVRFQVLPAAMPTILTGFILALARAVGETAPLIAIGAFTTVLFVPTTPTDSFTVLPVQIYSWISKPLPEFRENAAAGIIVLLVVLMLMNAVAITLRNIYSRRSRW